MQDRAWNFENEETPEPCEHRYYGSMRCAFCDEEWTAWEFEDLIAEVIELRSKVLELESLLNKEI